MRNKDNPKPFLGGEILPKFIGLFYDQGGNTWVELCEAEDEDAAYEELERNDANLMLFTIEGAKAVRENLDQKIREAES